MSIWSKIGKVLKKVAAPLLGIGASFIPGVGPAMSSAIGGIGNLIGSSASSQTGMAAPNAGPQLPQVQVTGQAPGFDWKGAIQTATPLIAGGLSYYGQNQANQTNASMAQQQMAFQAEQSGTAYQRAMADMEAAGINPMLSAIRGGAQAGGGAMATMQNDLGEGANSALSAFQTITQLSNIIRQGDQIEAQTNVLDAQAENYNADTADKLLRPALTGAQTQTERERTGQTAAMAREIMLRNVINDATQEAQKSSINSASRIKLLEEKGLKLGLNEKESRSGFWGSAIGEAYPYIEAGGETLSSAASAITRGMRLRTPMAAPRKTPYKAPNARR
nr:MAG: DNA pilot protein [Microvirus sp.]